MTTIIHPLPDEIISNDELDLSLDLGLKHYKFCFSDDGKLYVLTHISYWGKEKVYYNLLLSIFEPDGELKQQFVLHYILQSLWQTGDFVSCLTILSNNQIVIGSEDNKTFIFSADFTQLIAKFDTFYTYPKASPLRITGNLAFDLTRDFENRLLCAVSLLPRPSNALYNVLLAVSPKPVDFTEQPHLDFINIYDAPPFPAQGQENIYPYIFQDRHEYRSPAPEKVPSIKKQLSEKVFNGRFMVANAHFLFDTRIVALPNERFILPVFYFSRTIDKWSEFAFVMLNYAGEVIGHLKGIGLGAESPHLKQDYEVTFDPISQRIVYKNDFAFYFFNLDGELLRKELLKNEFYPALKEYRKLKLRACSPDGRLVLYDHQHNASLMISPIDILGNASKILSESMKDFKQNLRRFNKAQNPINHHWVTTQKPVRVKV